MTRSLKPLPFLAFLLGFSAVMKLGTGFSVASAQMPNNAQNTPPNVVIPDAATAPPELPGPAMAALEPSDLRPSLLVDLASREQALAERQARLQQQQHELAEAQRALTEQLASLQQAEQALAATMALADRAAEDDITRLVSVFEAMRPEQAAAVVSEMDTSFAVGLVARLRPETAAAIFAGIDPALAYGLSALLAGRNAEVPRR